MIRRLLFAGLIGTLSLGGFACSYPSDPGYTGTMTDPVPVQGVRLTPQSVVFTTIGETSQLTATVMPDTATDKAITWASSDTSVAAVDASGLVTARAAGSGVLVTVVTHDGRHEASTTITVEPPPAVVPVEAVKLTPQSIVLTAIGETRQLTVEVTPDNATDKSVAWVSSDTSVATVDANGLVTARGIGSGIFVTVVTNDGHRESSTNVTVNP